MKGGLIPHIDGVKDEYVDAAFVAGAIFLLWKLASRAATPSTVPPVSGPPATVLPPPAGGHIGPTAPPPSSGQGSGPNLLYHVPAPMGQRSYYGSGAATAPPQQVSQTVPQPVPVRQTAAFGPGYDAAGDAYHQGMPPAVTTRKDQGKKIQPKQAKPYYPPQHLPDPARATTAAGLRAAPGRAKSGHTPY